MSSSLRRGKASTPRTHNRREFGELVGVVEFACSCAGCGIDLAGGQYNLFFSNFDLLAPGDGDLVGVSGGRIWRGPGGPEVDTNRPIGQRLEWRFYDRLRARNPLLNADPKFCALVSKIFFIKFKKHCKRCELHPSITEDVGARRRRPSTPHRTSLRAKSNLLQAAADVVARLKSVFLWCRIIFRKSSRNIFTVLRNKITQLVRHRPSNVEVFHFLEH